MTDTSSETKFILRFPFRLAPGQELSNFDPPIEQEMGAVTLVLKHREPFYVLEAHGFDSESSAKELLSRLWAGLMWASLNRGIAFSADLNIAPVTYAEDPKKAAESFRKGFGIPRELEVHGMIDGRRPAIYPSNKKMLLMSAENVNVTTGIDSHIFYSLLLEGASLPNSSGVTSDVKLRTALELYEAYFYEKSSNARILTLVMALETLSGHESKHKVALDLLEQWRPAVEQLKEKYSQDSEEHEALEALERELLFRREASLRSQIRKLVVDALVIAGNPDAQEIGKRAVKVYNKRSTLVHQGFLTQMELIETEREAREIVESVLKAKFLHSNDYAAESP